MVAQGLEELRSAGEIEIFDRIFVLFRTSKIVVVDRGKGGAIRWKYIGSKLRS